jgi:hypothetical protein
MVTENIILQSAGSLSVGVVALLMMVLQTIFYFKRPQFSWYAWSAAISFSALLYSIGIFFEYNTPEGPLNRFSGLLELTAIIFIIHSMYGFTFSYLGIESRRYHRIAGVCHGAVLVLLWFTPWVVADRFVVRHFMGLASPYVEAALGPLGPVFVLYGVMASISIMFIWVRDPKTDSKNRFIYLAGIGFWVLLGFHDGLAALGVIHVSICHGIWISGFCHGGFMGCIQQLSGNRGGRKISRDHGICKRLYPGHTGGTGGF